MFGTQKHLLLKYLFGVLMVLYPPAYARSPRPKIFFAAFQALYLTFLIVTFMIFFSRQLTSRAFTVVTYIRYGEDFGVLFLNAIIFEELLRKGGHLREFLERLQFVHEMTNFQNFNRLLLVMYLWGFLCIVRLIQGLRHMDNLIGIISFDLGLQRAKAAIFVVCVALWIVTRHFRSLNNRLEKCDDMATAQSLTTLQHHLLNCSEQINEIFGNTILCSTMVCCLMTLSHLTHMKYNLVSYQRKFFINVFDLATYLGHHVVLGTLGEGLAFEAARTVEICFNLSMKWPNVGPRPLLSRYLALAEEGFQRRARFSAAGMFPVDHTLISLLITHVCTYFIVICQWIPQDMTG